MTVLVSLCVVSSGSVTINEDSSVQILAEEACTIDQLDAQVTYLLVSPDTAEDVMPSGVTVLTNDAPSFLIVHRPSLTKVITTVCSNSNNCPHMEWDKNLHPKSNFMLLVISRNN